MNNNVYKICDIFYLSVLQHFFLKGGRKGEKRKKVVYHKILWDIAIKIKFYGTLPKNMGFMGLSSKYGTKIKFYGTWQV